MSDDFKWRVKKHTAGQAAGMKGNPNCKNCGGSGMQPFANEICPCTHTVAPRYDALFFTPTAAPTASSPDNLFFRPGGDGDTVPGFTVVLEYQERDGLWAKADMLTPGNRWRIALYRDNCSKG